MSDTEYPRGAILAGQKIRMKPPLTLRDLLRVQIHPDDWDRMLLAFQEKPEGMARLCEYALWGDS